MSNALDDAGSFKLIGYRIVAFLIDEELKQEFAHQYEGFYSD